MGVRGIAIEGLRVIPKMATGSRRRAAIGSVRHVINIVACAKPPKAGSADWADRHLTVGKSLQVSFLEDESYRSRSIDALFKSLAQHAGPRTVGVILFGMLKNGAQGLKAIKQAGGIALVQEPKSAAYDEIPRAAIAFDGPVDIVGSIPQLAEAIRRYTAGIPAGAGVTAISAAWRRMRSSDALPAALDFCQGR